MTERVFLSTPLPLGQDNGPPGEFRLLAMGRNATVYGDFWLSPEGAAQAVSTFQMGGVDLAFDWHHWSEMTSSPMAPPSGDATKAAGWFGLEARSDGLWAARPPHLEGATQIFWTPEADSQIRNLEYRYFSPALEYSKDPEGKRWITGVTSCALTNRPATRNQAPLLASAVPYDGAPVDDKSTWDASAAEGRLRTWAGGEAAIDWAKYRKGFAWYDDQNPETFGAYKLPHHDVVGGKLVTSKAGVEAAAAVVAGSRGGADIADVAAVKAHLAKHYHQWGATAPWEAQTEQRPMETTTPTAQAAQLAKDKAFLAAERVASHVRMLLRKPDDADPSEVIGSLQALFEKAAKYDEAVAEVDKIRLEKNEVEAKALLAQARHDKKIAPTEEAHLLAQGKKDPAFLKAYLADKPRAIPGVDVREPAKGAGPGAAPVGVPTTEDGRTWEKLAPMEKARLHAEQPEVYALLHDDWKKRTGRFNLLK